MQLMLSCSSCSHAVHVLMQYLDVLMQYLDVLMQYLDVLMRLIFSCSSCSHALDVFMQYLDEVGGYLDEVGRGPEVLEVLEDNLALLRSLANMCQVHPASGEHGGQEWHDKAAVYRQHVIAVLKRLGRSVPSKCGLCHKALNADKATDRMTPWSALIVQECGHILHIMCLMNWQGKPGQQCPTCVVRSKREN